MKNNKINKKFYRLGITISFMFMSFVIEKIHGVFLRKVQTKLYAKSK